ncbi:MAG TPA: cytochrome P450 [Alphaproteobacteria bacterium]|nr:cytochrome P450 [Alphaproteobacteria bacterium]
MATLLYDPRQPSVSADPYAAFAQLRASDPVHWSPVLRGWVLTRYTDVRAALFDPNLSADRITPFVANLSAEKRQQLSGLERVLTRWAVFVDPPAHTRLRGLINKAFTPRAIASLAGMIRATVDRLIDDFAAGIAPGGEGKVDLIAGFSYPLPALVIARILGVPDQDIRLFKAWSDDLAAFVGSAQATPDKYDRAARGAAEMDAYFRAIVRQRRTMTHQADVIGALVAAEEAGRALSEDELVATAVLVLFAGHETTANLIGNGMIALIEQPEAMALLRTCPELAESAVEELLRIDSPAASVTRVARSDMVLGGKTIRAGDRLFLMINAANRDPAVFPDPDRLRLDRDPNPHVAFGYGPHYCVGAPLARLEAQIAFGRLLARLDDIRLAEEPLDWSDNLVLRGVKRLPLTFRLIE